MSSEEHFEIAQSRDFEAEELEVIPKTSVDLSYKQLEEILKKGQEFTDFIKELDPIVERKSKVTKLIDESLKCYKKEALEKFQKVVIQPKMTNSLKLDKMLINLVKPKVWSPGFLNFRLQPP